MRTTVNIDDRLLAEAKLIAARQHRTIGSVLEDALRKLIADEARDSVSRGDYVLHTFVPEMSGVLPGVDLEDRELMAQLLGDNAVPGDHAGHAPA
ncbi:CopG family transcriptional regulator [Intrasporangium oryzae NRRL B-24470]|uniref:CopG family transcriptional regulator n=1 Tax=Intrasporangium oryzae NRRL B-24470 TaxID=1386089 RepID=W9GAV9_9MICO|nr:type II toxin-antitoxin system VapB family antitoxin [Intrasporangium oryzae]EWT03336.1 CopG family transcriptional regulator [Intrasporangium oryzae NRRL B-24470]